MMLTQKTESPFPKKNKARLLGALFCTVLHFAGHIEAAPIVLPDADLLYTSFESSESPSYPTGAVGGVLWTGTWKISATRISRQTRRSSRNRAGRISSASRMSPAPRADALRFASQPSFPMREHALKVLGLWPFSARNVLQKCAESANPVSAAISLIVKSELERSFSAFSTRACLKKARGEI